MKTDDTEANDYQLNVFSVYKLILYLHQHLIFYLSAFFFTLFLSVLTNILMLQFTFPALSPTLLDLFTFFTFRFYIYFYIPAICSNY